jgi:hypothetical protein
MMSCTIYSEHFFSNIKLVIASAETEVHQWVYKLKQYSRISYPSNVSYYYQAKALTCLITKLHHSLFFTRLLNNIYGVHFVS